MSAPRGKCLGCGETGKLLRVDFCQRCEGRIDEAGRIAIRCDAWLVKEMNLRIAKLEANAVHVAERRRAVAVVCGLRPLAEEDRKRIVLALDENVRGLLAERGPLIAKIGRQHAYIVMLRAKRRPR